MRVQVRLLMVAVLRPPSHEDDLNGEDHVSEGLSLGAIERADHIVTSHDLPEELRPDAALGFVTPGIGQEAG